MPLLPGSSSRRLAAVVLLAALATVFASCEKPDASYVTSPSIEALIGTSTGNVAFFPAEAAPAAVEPPQGWELSLELALFGELEDGSDALRIVMQVQSKVGKGFEVWLSNDTGTVARWSAGSSKGYDGVVCFQLPLKSKVTDKATNQSHTELLPLERGKYRATVVFRDVESGVMAARELKVTGNVPKLSGPVPGPDSPVFKKALGCPRGT